MTERVLVSVKDGVADVRLNRPEKLNALDPEMFSAIRDAGEKLKTARGVRAVVVSGEGRGFCAGLDFSSFQAMGGSDRVRDRDVTGGDGSSDGAITHGGQQAAWVWTELEVPVIAAIHGQCLGGGLQIALGADIRIVAPDASLSVLEIRWGLTPDMTATVTLPRLVGLDVAKELLWTGRTVDGREAVGLGLATRCADDPRAAARALAADLASKSPHAIRAGKRLLTGLADRSAAEQLSLERKEIGSLIGGPNQVESVNAYFAKRAPIYTDIGPEQV
jgi:enoyl-CoA hydratase/carnithine racemase